MPYNTTYVKVGIVKILSHLKVLAFSIKCSLFCSLGKQVPLFLSMVSYLIVMTWYKHIVQNTDFLTICYSLDAGLPLAVHRTYASFCPSVFIFSCFAALSKKFSLAVWDACLLNACCFLDTGPPLSVVAGLVCGWA